MERPFYTIRKHKTTYVVLAHPDKNHLDSYSMVAFFHTNAFADGKKNAEKFLNQITEENSDDRR